MTLKGWRTVLINAVVAFASVGIEFMPYLLGVDWTALGFNPTVASRTAFAISLANIGLRVITTSPLGEKV